MHRELVEEVSDYLTGLAQHVPVLALGPKPFLGIDPRSLKLEQEENNQINPIIISYNKTFILLEKIVL